MSNILLMLFQTVHQSLMFAICSFITVYIKSQETCTAPSDTEKYLTHTGNICLFPLFEASLATEKYTLTFRRRQIIIFRSRRHEECADIASAFS
jgi:hypothetical protein